MRYSEKKIVVTLTADVASCARPKDEEKGEKTRIVRRRDAWIATRGDALKPAVLKKDRETKERYREKEKNDDDDVDG